MVGFGRACVYVVRNQGLELSYEMVCLLLLLLCIHWDEISDPSTNLSIPLIPSFLGGAGIIGETLDTWLTIARVHFKNGKENHVQHHRLKFFFLIFFFFFNPYY